MNSTLSEFEHRALLETILDQMPSGVLVIDTHGQVLVRNEAGRQIVGNDKLGSDQATNVGYQALDIETGEVLTDDQSPLMAALQGAHIEDYQYVLRRPGNLPDVAIKASYRPLRSEDGEVLGTVMVYSDITREFTLRREMAQREAHLREIYDTLPSGIIVRAPTGEVKFANKAALQLMRVETLDELPAAFAGVKAVDAEGQPAKWPMGQMLRTGQPIKDGLLGLTFPDGDVRWHRYEMLPRFGPDGALIEGLLSFDDITEQKQAQEQLLHAALHDSLTGLPNRILLHDRIEQAIEVAHRDGRCTALMFIDLDGFKEVNDTFGHQRGDELLAAVGPRLRQVVRAIDTVARLGGDEFAVVLNSLTGRAQAEALATKVLEALEPPFMVGSEMVQVSASIGIALSPQHGDDVSSLLQKADAAMYVAKQQKNSYAVFAEPREEPSLNRLVLAAELRQAIELDGLELHYQPKIALRTGRLVGVEALARWTHGQHGAIPPEQFVRVAETTGIIRQLSHWVVRTALRQLREWRDAGLQLNAAVNLSVRDLRDPQLPQTLRQLLGEFEAEPSWLDIEITETMIMADPRQTMDAVRRLNHMGFAFCIDDFGTGYSSLSYLRDLPAREIKIDKSFVMDLLRDNSDATIVRSVVDLAHNLGRTTVAEGVERPEVLQALGELGCDIAQGYYMGHPMPAADFERWLREEHLAGTRALVA